MYNTSSQSVSHRAFIQQYTRASELHKGSECRVVQNKHVFGHEVDEEYLPAVALDVGAVPVELHPGDTGRRQAEVVHGLRVAVVQHEAALLEHVLLTELQRYF